MKRLLILSPRWIPLTAPDLQRVRMSLPHYRNHGWEPVILCVDAAFAGGPREPELALTIPDDVRTYRSRALPRRLTLLAGVGSLGLRSWRHLWRAGLEIISREKIDLVFVSTTEFIACHVARRWKLATGVPYVIDIQDPWITSHYKDTGTAPPGGWKFRYSQWLAHILEERSYAGAGGFISVSPRYIGNLQERYRWMRDRPTATVVFGGSVDDMAAGSRIASAISPQFTRAQGEVHLVYTGAAGPVGIPALDALFQALGELTRRHGDRARRIHLHFIGTSYGSERDPVPTILPQAERWGVTAQVHERPARVSYLESLQWQAQSDALLLLASADPAYSPSKLYPYFLSGRPILALFREDSGLRLLLQPLGGAVLVGLNAENPAGTPQPASAILSFLTAALDGFPEGSVPPRHPTYFHDHYGAQTLTQRQCTLFDQVAAIRQH